MDGDYIVRGTSRDGQIRFFAARTTQLVEELRKRHGTTPTVSAAIGRTATIAAMMGMMLKGEERVTVQIVGGGPIGQIVVDAYASGKVRAYVTDPTIDLPLNARGKLDVAQAVGTKGFLHVLKDLGMKEPYRGTVPIVSGEIAEDFSYYFTVSEQTPSAVGAGVLVDRDYSICAAGGFIVQRMPASTSDDVQEIEHRLAQLPQLTSLLQAGKTPEDVIKELLPWPLAILDRVPVQFGCRCSRIKTEQTLISLGANELAKMIEERIGAEVICHFCAEKHQFSDKDLERLLDEVLSRKQEHESSED